MNNYIDFKVDCPKSTFRTQIIRVYYVRNDGKPFPLPPNYCENADFSGTCQRCNVEVLEKALTTQPPFFR